MRRSNAEMLLDGLGCAPPRLSVLQGSPLPYAIVHRSDSIHRRALRGRSRFGFTLFELIVAMVVMGLVAAFAMPSLETPARDAGALSSVIPRARGAAIARAQTLVLTVTGQGGWTLTPLPPDDSVIVLRGQLDTSPTVGFRLRLTPVGACLSSSPLPEELGAWDAARCAPPRDRRRPL